MRVGRLPEQADLMEEQRTIIREFVQQVGGVVARCWEVEGGADSRAGKAARQEMLDYAKENAGMLDGLLICGADRLTREGILSGLRPATELEAVSVKIVSLPVGPTTEWTAFAEALDWGRAKKHRHDNELHGPQRVVAVLRASAREPGAGLLARQRKQLDVYARKAGLELTWLRSNEGSQ
jgi:DNA invertase Pin-like site-specific DNA recombinase